MSKLSTGILGTIAVSLSLGAAQFAAGQDLAGTFQVSAGTSAFQIAAGTSEASINRAAKADRAATVAASAAPTRTVSLRLESLADTSILIRLPLAQEARNRPVSPSLTKPGRMTEACEGMVSVLTEIARQLQPGRCVT